MSELSDRLKAFLTPEQRDELRLALAACDSWLNPTPPKSSDPEKVINWREGDWWSVLDDGKVLWLNSHDMCIDVVDFYKGRNCWGARINGHTRLTDSEGDARAAALGYTVKRAEKVEAGASKVFEFIDGDVVTRYPTGTARFLVRGGIYYVFSQGCDIPNLKKCLGQKRIETEIDCTRAEITDHLDSLGITAKFPDDTPASDSVKGERDKFGREIVERLGGAFIVKCENGRYSVSRGDGRWWDCIEAGSWCEDRDLQSGCFSVLDVARSHMKLAAASLELPTANPAASAKGDDGDIDAMRIAWNGVNTTTSYREDFLFGELLKLKREVAALKAVK